jgi:branched-chain amino acid transport system substrate-binding protein
VVNDAARRTLADLPASVFTTTTITALAPRATASGVFGQRLVAALQGAASGVFAENAFDCVNLIALAAAQSGSTRSADIASNIVSASAGGSVCTDYSTCVQLIDQRRNIDYGPIRLGAGGDVDESVFDVVDIVRGGETKQRTVTVSA